MMNYNMFNNFEKLSASINENVLEIISGDKKYIFKNSLMPTSIEINGINVLTEPVALNMGFDDPHNGFEDFYCQITEQTPEKIVAILAATCGNVVINETVTAEPDGFVVVELKVSSFWMFSKDNKKTPKLNKMNITVSVKDEYSSLFHYWPNDRQSILPADDIVNSGATENFEFMFKPYVWTGNNREGLGLYFGDTFEPFQIENEDKCIVVSKNNESTTITLNMLDSMPLNWQGRDDHWCETLKPQFFTIGFQATPVAKKTTLPYDEYYKRIHVSNAEFVDEKNIGIFAEKGVKWVIVHEDWTAVQNYGLPYNEEQFKELVKKYHKKGIKVMVYYGYEYSTITPNFTKNCNSYLNKTINGNFTGGWQRNPPQRAFMVCYNGRYTDEMIERVKYSMDVLGVDGIYTDGTYVPWECANEAHGCGYTDKNGERHTTFPVMAVREHVKKLYKAVHERGGIIDTHNSSCCIMPTLAFADSCYDGENINNAVINGGIEFLSLDGFKAEFMGINYGFIPNFISYVSKPEELMKIVALTLIHNVLVRPSTFSGCTLNSQIVLEPMADIWKIFDRYNLNEKQWVPYFENNEVVSNEDKVYVSLYKDKKETVAVVSGFNKNEETTLTLSGYKKVIDIKSDEEYKVKDNMVTIKLLPDAPNFFRVV